VFVVHKHVLQVSIIEIP